MWQIAARNLALMHIAIYDAMVAADSKYAYKRSRPSAVNADLTTTVLNPPSPSYPAEHAVAAGAASEVLTYIFPERGEFFRKLADGAARSRLIAGVNYESDRGGQALGRQVAVLLVIARGKSDGTDAKWTEFGANRPRKVDRYEPDPANGRHLETMGVVFARRIPPRPADHLRFAGEGGGARRDQELSAHAANKQ